MGLLLLFSMAVGLGRGPGSCAVPIDRCRTAWLTLLIHQRRYATFPFCSAWERERDSNPTLALVFFLAIDPTSVEPSIFFFPARSSFLFFQRGTRKFNSTGTHQQASIIFSLQKFLFDKCFIEIILKYISKSWIVNLCLKVVRYDFQIILVSWKLC